VTGKTKYVLVFGPCKIEDILKNGKLIAKTIAGDYVVELYEGKSLPGIELTERDLKRGCHDIYHNPG